MGIAARCRYRSTKCCKKYAYGAIWLMTANLVFILQGTDAGCIIKPDIEIISRYDEIQELNCTSDRSFELEWYINDILDPQLNPIRGTAVNTQFTQGSFYTYLTIQPIEHIVTQLNTKCGDGSTFSKTVTVIWIKDLPSFNCTLTISGSVVSWSQCVNPQDYIDRYIYNITDSTTGSSIVLNNITIMTSLDFQSYLCGTTYQLSVRPVNVMGEGNGAVVNYSHVCPTSTVPSKSYSFTDSRISCLRMTSTPASSFNTPILKQASPVYNMEIAIGVAIVFAMTVVILVVLLVTLLWCVCRKSSIKTKSVNDGLSVHSHKTTNQVPL